MSFFKNAAVFTSGVIVGAAGLTAFVGYQAFKMLKKNDVLYSAVEDSVKAGVHAGGNEFGNRFGKIVADWLFDKPSVSTNGKMSYPSRYGNVPEYDIPVYPSRATAEQTLSEMNDLINQFGSVTIDDLYDISGLTQKDHTFKKYGWTNLDDAMVICTTRGYTLTLNNPRPI